MAALRRFYKTATAAPASGGHTVHLDGRALRTPGGNALLLPGRALAEAIAGEWDAQGEEFALPEMYLTRLAFTAIDRVAPQHGAVAAQAAAFARADVMCYRADAPSELVERQKAAWDPLLDWAAARFRAPLATGTGLGFVEQSDEALRALETYLARLDPFRLAALQNAAGLTGSLVVALALAEGERDVEAAFAAAHLEELYQAEVWGTDPEAAARREQTRTELAATARFLDLLNA